MRHGITRGTVDVRPSSTEVETMSAGQCAVGLGDRDRLFRVAPVEAVTEGNERPVAKDLGLKEVAGHVRIGALVVERPLEMPCLPEVA